jgi:hypothetical protein
MPRLNPTAANWDEVEPFDDENERSGLPKPIHFDSVVNSAFDFFRKAFSEVAKEPKYSVIHFYSGVELLFKARLLHEHWALAVTKPEFAVLAKFKAGDFQSVTLSQAMERLRNISDEVFRKDEQACFENLGRHRNQIVHFFHQGYAAAPPDKKVVGEVAAEQFRAWVFIHELLTKRWADHFHDHLQEVGALDDQVKKHKQFLATKFGLVKDDLKNHRRAGLKIVVCEACSFRSAVLDRDDPPLRESRCLVCDRRHAVIVKLCDDCNVAVEFDDTGEGTCPKCDTNYKITDLLAEFGPGGDPREEPDMAHCSDCERTDHATVVPFEGGYLCLNCASTFTSWDHCGWCSTPIAGADLSTSYLSGCMMCDGQIGNDRD